MAGAYSQRYRQLGARAAEEEARHAREEMDEKARLLRLESKKRRARMKKAAAEREAAELRAKEEALRERAERMKKHAEGFKTSVEEQRRQRAKAQKRKQEERLKKWEGLSFDRPPPPEYNGEHRSESIVADPYAARAAGPGAIVRPLDRAAQSRPRASPADVMNRVREHEQMLASAMEAIRGGGSSHDPHDEGHAVVSNIESPSSSQQQYAENTGVRRHAHSRDTHSRGSRRTNDSPRRGSSSRSEASSRRAESDDERQGNGAVFTGAEFPPGEVLVSPSQLHRGRESVSSVDSLDAESESRIQDTPQRTHGWGAPEQGTASDPVSPAKATGDADDDDSGESDGVDEGYHQYSARNQFATDRQPSSASTTRRTHNRPRSKETRNEQGPPPNRFGWSGSEPRIPHRSVQRPKESRPSGPRRPRPNRARVDDTPPARPKEMPSVRVSWAQPRSESQEPYRSAAEPTMSVSSRGHDGHDDDGRRVRRNNNERGRHRAEVIDYEIKSARTPTDNEIELLWDAVRKGLQGHRGEPAPSSAQHSNRTPRSREAPDSRGSGGQRAETALARARDVQRNFDKKYTWEDEAAAQGNAESLEQQELELMRALEELDMPPQTPKQEPKPKKPKRKLTADEAVALRKSINNAQAALAAMRAANRE